MRTLLKNCLVCGAGQWMLPADILVSGGLIERVGPGLEEPADQVIDMGGAKVLPGVIDAHVHLVTGPIEYNDVSLKNWAKSGVTFVRDLGLGNSKSIAQFMEWAETVKDDPACCGFITCGKFVTARGGYCHIMPNGVEAGIGVETPEEAAAAVEYLHGQGCACIKTTRDPGHGGLFGGELPMPSEACYRAMVETGKRYGMPVCAHVLDAEVCPPLVESGVGEWAHMPVNGRVPDELLEKMVERGIYVTPTICTTVPEAQPDMPPPPDMPDDMPPPPPMDPAEEAKKHETVLDNTRRFHEKGGRLALGTDTMRMESWAGPVGMPVWELRELYKAGLTVQEVITAATLNAAHVCGVDDVMGSVEAGKQANLIAVKGELDGSFDAMAHVDFVMNRGTVIVPLN